MATQHTDEEKQHASLAGSPKCRVLPRKEDKRTMSNSTPWDIIKIEFNFRVFYIQIKCIIRFFKKKEKTSRKCM